MSLSKNITVDQIEVVANGVVQVRTRTDVVEDGAVISSALHRHSVAPGADYSGEDSRVQAICSATHTADVIAAYQAAAAAKGV
jgi:hypothetical protein